LTKCAFVNTFIARMGINFYEGKCVTFVILPEGRIFFQTRKQSCYLEHLQSSNRRRLKFIANLIMLGEIYDLNDLAGYCGDDIRWVATSRRFERHDAPVPV